MTGMVLKDSPPTFQGIRNLHLMTLHFMTLKKSFVNSLGPLSLEVEVKVKVMEDLGIKEV